jgi:hypothetical protein
VVYMVLKKVRFNCHLEKLILTLEYSAKVIFFFSRVSELTNSYEFLCVADCAN